MSIRFSAIFRRFEQFSPRLDSRVGSKGDRESLTLFFLSRCSLIISVLCISSFYALVFSQKSNTACFDSLFHRHLTRFGSSVGKVDGYRSAELNDVLKLDTTLTRTLIVEEPVVDFVKIDQRYWVRTMDLGFRHQIGDSLVGEYAEFLRDTIQGQQLAQVRRKSDAALRGNDPRFLPNFALPAACVLSGVAGIISLFYIRSR